MAKPQVGIQLYTLREDTAKDFLGTIRKAADIGYKAVEFAGYFGVSAKELKKVLDDCGLTAPSSHVGLNWGEPDKLEADLAAQIEYAQEIGLEYIVVPSAPFPKNATAGDIDRILSGLEAAAKQVKSAGMKFGYHNHDFEFRQVDGKPIIDHMLERIPADLLIAEFDLGWVHVGGYRPVDYIRKYAGRVPLAHIKDFKEGRSDTEIGRGIVDFKSVFDIAEEAGIRYYFVEQEQFAASPLESAKISFDYFKAENMV